MPVRKRPWVFVCVCCVCVRCGDHLCEFSMVVSSVDVSVGYLVCVLSVLVSVCVFV